MARPPKSASARASPDDLFAYERATDARAAVALGARDGARYLGGGTNLVDLMRETIEHPRVLVDVTGLSQEIEDTPEGGLEDRLPA